MTVASRHVRKFWRSTTCPCGSVGKLPEKEGLVGLHVDLRVRRPPPEAPIKAEFGSFVGDEWWEDEACMRHHDCDEGVKCVWWTKREKVIEELDNNGSLVVSFDVLLWFKEPCPARPNKIGLG